MSSPRRSGAPEDSILGSLERGSTGTRNHRSWLVIGAAAAAVLTLMLAWIAYSNATSVRTLPPSAVKRAVAPAADDGMPDQPVPSMTIRAPEAAAIIDERAAEPPALVMLPPNDDRGIKAAPEASPLSQPARRPARPVALRMAAAPKQAARPAKAPAVRPTAKQRKNIPPSKDSAQEVDSDVALISAIVAHSSRHAAERAQQQNCNGKKCTSQPSTPP